MIGFAIDYPMGVWPHQKKLIISIEAYFKPSDRYYSTF